jgi:hypothetical protein
VADRISIGESQGQIVQTRIVPDHQDRVCLLKPRFASKITFAGFSFLAIGSSVSLVRTAVEHSTMSGAIAVRFMCLAIALAAARSALAEGPPMIVQPRLFPA